MSDADTIREALHHTTDFQWGRDAVAALDALVAERDEARRDGQEAREHWRKKARAAEAERDEARRLLREVVKADQQDAQMGYPIPGDSCMGAFIGLVLMRYLDDLANGEKLA